MSQISEKEWELSLSGSRGIRTKLSKEKGIFQILAVPTEKSEERELSVTFSFPIRDIAGQWFPDCGMRRVLSADWEAECRSTIAISAPVLCLFSEGGSNRLTMAVSETEKQVFFRGGVHEENGWIHMSVRIPLQEADFPYTVKLRIDREEKPFEDALAQTAAWWEEECGIIPMQVPDFAGDPVYSTWYSYHQNVNAEKLEKEAKLAVKAGFKTMILDDGWQTSDTNRGYAFCGDWQAVPEKMGNMAEHVKRIHEIGMRYMMWFSVPFVGKKSSAWDRFQKKLLRYDEEQQAGILDLRYPDVREYLIGIYEKALREWDLDGLKLDFVDCFFDRDGTNGAMLPGMDIAGIEHSVAVFMKELKEKLLKIRPEILIEFRQKYIGPSIRVAGNLLRVSDCPMSGISNRVGSVDIRLISRKTAIHSDMLMWNRGESAEAVVRQLFDVIFATLQLSVKLEEQSEEQMKAICFWVNFMKKYRGVLQMGEIHPSSPQLLYPVVRACREDIEIQAVYEKDRLMTISPEKKESWILNAADSKNVLVRFCQEKTFLVETYNCLGDLLQTETVEGKPGKILEFCTGASGAVCVKADRKSRN